MVVSSAARLVFLPSQRTIHLPGLSSRMSVRYLPVASLTISAVGWVKVLMASAGEYTFTRTCAGSTNAPVKMSVNSTETRATSPRSYSAIGLIEGDDEGAGREAQRVADLDGFRNDLLDQSGADRGQ